MKELWFTTLFFLCLCILGYSQENEEPQVDSFEEEIPQGGRDQEIPQRRIEQEIPQRHTAEEVQYIKAKIIRLVNSRTFYNRDDILWEDGIVPYSLSSRYSVSDRRNILEAMKEFHNKTCIRFVPRKSEISYALIEPGNTCFSIVGQQQDRKNRVTLAQPCLDRGTIMHELMHTLGFLHEQNRPDRDEYVRIVYENILDGGSKNFAKFSWDDVDSVGQSYDYDSLMHYGAFEFSKDEQSPSIVPLQKGAQIGQRRGLSEKDLLKIRTRYNCQ